MATYILYGAYRMLLLMARYGSFGSHLPWHTALLKSFLQRLAPGVQDHIRRVVLLVARNHW